MKPDGEVHIEPGVPRDDVVGTARARADNRDFQALLDMSVDWTWETDSAHRLRNIGEGCARAMGVSPDSLIGRSRIQPLLRIAETDPAVAAHLRDVTARRPFRDFLQHLPNSPAQCRFVLLSGMPVFDEEGRFAGYRGTARNVTAAVEAADAARQTARPSRKGHRTLGEATDAHGGQLVAALNAMSDAFVVFNGEDHIVLFNDALLKMYRGLEDIIRPGLAFADLLDAGLARGIWDLRDVDAEAWKADFLARRVTDGESTTEIRFADGRWAMHRELPTEDGGRMGICVDITALKEGEAKAERARREAEAERMRLQSAIDALSDGFVVWDADDRLVACNNAFRQQFAPFTGFEVGRTYEELLLGFVRTGVVKEARGREEEWTKAQVSTRAEDLDQEFVFETHDGRWMMRRDRSTSSGDRVGIRTDVTRMKRHEKEIAEANERTRELLFDLERTIDTMGMGVVLLDANLRAEVINKAFYSIWRLGSGDIAVGDPFRALMDINRHNSIYDVRDEDWDDYVAMRVEEIRQGDVAPREFGRADGSTLIYSVTSLSGGKRLVCYYDVSEIKRREAELAEALERSWLASAVINGVEDPVFAKDEDMRFVFANQAFASQFGTTPEAMIGRRAGEYIGDADAAVFEQSECMVLETGEAFHIEEDFEHEGGIHSRIVRKNRITADSGRSYVSCFVYDVTEIRRREREAQEARRQLAKVLDTLPAGVIIYDKDDRLVLSNRKISETLPSIAQLTSPGSALEAAMEAAYDAGYFKHSDDPVLDALHGSDREAWIRRMIDRYHRTHAVSERQTPDGRWHQVYDTRSEDGLFVGVRVDITELKEREAALRETTRENELFRRLIDNVPVAIYAKHNDLRLLYVNQGWCDLTGFSKEEAIGRTDGEVFGPDGLAFMASDRAVLLSGEVLETEETATSADGTPRFQIARKSTMRASDGSLYLIGSTTDVTELKRREEELREAEKRAVLADRAKSEFLANMSHEIRTPMNGVLGMAELLARTELDAKQRTFTDIIVKSGNALLTIINDILDFSKIDAGQLVLDPAPFNLAESVEDVATLMATRAKEKDLELIVRVDPNLPKIVVGDAGRLRQIVTNLVGNAVKFTDAGHVLVDVTGRCEDSQAFLHFRIEDTGIGIPEDKLGQVFEKFSQVDTSSTRRHEGTGLGLAITARLVELMNGQIGVDSRMGLGSTFWFKIALPMGERCESVRTSAVDVSGARVLVVDDNAVNRAILMEQMRSWGFDACAAQSGVEALAVLQTAADLGVHVDCAVLDYQMPEMSGIDVAERIRELPAVAETPIVLLTSIDQALSGSQSAHLRIGVQLIKPARSKALLEAIVGEIQKRRGAAVETAEAEARAPEPKAMAAAVPPAKSYGSGRRLDILVAEDNEVNQLVFAQMLSETSYTYEIVRNGRLAVEAHAEMRPGMILMDVSMPQMNGLEATEAIRAAEAGGPFRVPIVGVTAHALKGDRERCLAAGMDDYLSKPISPHALLQKVRRWLEEEPEGAARNVG